MPEDGICRNEFGEHLNAFLTCEIEDGDAICAQPVEAARKVHRIADDNGADAELPNQAAAIPARRERRDHNFVAIAALAACIAKRGGFGVHRGIAVLNAAIVPAAEEFSLGIE